MPDLRRVPTTSCAAGLLALLAVIGGCSSHGVEEKSPTPKKVVTAGNGHTCAVRSDGVLSCWGWNSHGQLGDGTTNNTSIPVEVGVNQVWLDAAAGQYHTCAISAARELWCWGENADGQLGIGTESEHSPPVTALSGGQWAHVSAGSNHSCGIKLDGTLWCWGANFSGQIGNGEEGLNRKSLAPEQITSYADWTWIQAGDSHTCGLRADGSAWCWGNNVMGQLGDGTETNHPLPQLVAPDTPGTKWAAIDAGYYHTCGIRDNRSMWCWGDNQFGQLGVGTTSGMGDKRLEPAHVGATSDWAQIALGDYHTCGRRMDKSIWCWGSNAYGQLGDGVPPSYPGDGGLVDGGLDYHCQPGMDAAIPQGINDTQPWWDLTSGNDHTCSLVGDNIMWCWGRNDYGQLGDGTTENSSCPVSVVKQ